MEVALRAGARAAYLLDDASELDFAWLDGVDTLGLTAGASAPDCLVDGVMQALSERFDIEVAEGGDVRETVVFKLPRVLTQA